MYARIGAPLEVHQVGSVQISVPGFLTWALPVLTWTCSVEEVREFAAQEDIEVDFASVRIEEDGRYSAPFRPIPRLLCEQVNEGAHEAVDWVDLDLTIDRAGDRGGTVDGKIEFDATESNGAMIVSAVVPTIGGDRPELTALELDNDELHETVREHLDRKFPDRKWERVGPWIVGGRWEATSTWRAKR